MSANSSRRQFLKYVAAGATGVSALATTGSAKQPVATIDSCTVITEPGHYEFGSDITFSESSGICIRVRASNVTIDGKGNTLQSTNNARTIGISTDDTSKNVCVKNLEIRNFENGVNVVGTHNRFTNLTVENNSIQGFILVGDGTTITNCHICGNRGGIGAVVSNSHTISHNTINSNTVLGIVFRQGVSRSTLKGNTVSYNAERGITAWEGGDQNRILDNVTEGNGIRGISINDFNPERATKILIKGNRVLENGEDGVFLRQVDNSTIKSNTVKRNGDDGIELEESNANRLVRNVVCDNEDEQLVVGPNSKGNLLRNNTIDCSLTCSTD